MSRTLLLQMELCRWHGAYKEAGILSFDLSRRVGTRRGKSDITHKLGKVSNLSLKQAKYLLLGFCFYPSHHQY